MSDSDFYSKPKNQDGALSDEYDINEINKHQIKENMLDQTASEPSLKNQNERLISRVSSAQSGNIHALTNKLKFLAKSNHP